MRRWPALIIGALALGWGGAAVALGLAAFEGPHPEPNEALVLAVPMFACAVLGAGLAARVVRRRTVAGRHLRWFCFSLAGGMVLAMTMGALAGTSAGGPPTDHRWTGAQLGSLAALVLCGWLVRPAAAVAVDPS
ncbi:MAG: hypothetical protein ACKV2O_22250 [Acidimicrobiales bacterium]